MSDGILSGIAITTSIWFYCFSSQVYSNNKYYQFNIKLYLPKSDNAIRAYPKISFVFLRPQFENPLFPVSRKTLP